MMVYFVYGYLGFGYRNLFRVANMTFSSLAIGRDMRSHHVMGDEVTSDGP